MRLLRVAAAVTLLSSVAAACIMLPGPPTKLRGTAIIGRFTYAGKPLKGSEVELRKQGRLVAKTVTDDSGNYVFPAKEGGIYEVRMLNPSYETFHVALALNSKIQQKFLVNFFADYCYDINVRRK